MLHLRGEASTSDSAAICNMSNTGGNATRRQHVEYKRQCRNMVRINATRHSQGVWGSLLAYLSLVIRKNMSNQHKLTNTCYQAQATDPMHTSIHTNGETWPGITPMLWICKRAFLSVDPPLGFATLLT